jgi:hypothetical protein
MKTSPSALIKAEGCLRAWAGGHVHGDWESQSFEGAKGEDGHEQIENFIQYGTRFENTPLGRTASLSIPYLPTRADLPQIERKMTVVCGSHEFSNCKPDIMYLAPDGPVVMDHKFKNDFKWILSKNKLKVDLPANVYARAAMREFGFDFCKLQWLNYKLEVVDENGKTLYPAELKVVEVVVYEDEVAGVLRARKATLDKMEMVQKKKLPFLEVEFNTDYCHKYGQKRPCWHHPDNTGKAKLKCFSEVSR